MTEKSGRFHRISTKFICGTAGILLLILTASLFMNSRLIERFYLRRQIGYVQQTCSRLKEQLKQGLSPDDVINHLETTENVLIVYSENTSDYDRLSNDLREKFRQKGLGFQKFWMWDQDYISAIEKGYQIRLYRQDKLNYGILVEYIPSGDNLFAIAAVVPNAADFIKLINHFHILLYAFSLLAAVLFIGLLVKHITNPLRQMEVFSQQISRQEYGFLEINTHDELATVAKSMNQMSSAIQQYETILIARNQQMHQLLDDVAHDLKTPISLIGMYAGGIKDGMDDGTFLETIIQQNTKMSQLTERLLSLSRIEQKEHLLSPVFLDRLLLKCIGEQKLMLQDRNLSIQASVFPDVELCGNAELITTLFSNLLSNAIKYAVSGSIEVRLWKDGNQCCFLISNEYRNDALDLERIWEPFYVGEPSRNKSLSGTGLGLPIAKKIAEQFGYFIRCGESNGRIFFEVIFPV